MGRIVILIVALSALWLLLSGYFDHTLLLIFGAASVVLSVWLAHRAGVLDAEGVPGGLMPRIFGYWFWLAKEIGKANLLVGRQALALNPQYSPTMFMVPIAPKTNAGIATFANSITLTPGTVSVNLEADHILVHALTEDLADVEGIAEMGRRVAAAEAGGA
ncbi:MAG: Na+/H+ antiporter subunit E [Pseudomonadota bacterium]